MQPINLEQYFQKIKLPLTSLLSLSAEEKISFLSNLYFAHVKTFPYSNFELRHIGAQHLIQRQSLSFFTYKLLLSSIHGGYCYQSAALMFDALTQLGYKTEFCAARVLIGAPVNDPKVLALPPTHLVLVVTIEDKKFLLDPGMGSSAPRYPVLITEKSEPIIQDNETFRFYPVNDVYVLEKKSSQGWFRLIQTDLTPISQKSAQLNLLKLERHPAPISIRDSKTVVGIITDLGYKSLIWDVSSNQLKFSKKEGKESTEEILDSFEDAQHLLEKEFDINHISAATLEVACTQTMPRPIKPWTVDFPLTQSDLIKMEENLSFTP